MKKYLLPIAACLMLVFQGCDNDDNTEQPVDPQTEQALLNKYPTATNIRWSSENGYNIAEFILTSGSSRNECTAWFDWDNIWRMTKTELTFSELPTAVKEAFQSSEYSGWRIDDVEKLERDGIETIYVIEVEGRIDEVEVDIDLHYSSEGILVRTDFEADGDYTGLIPQSLSDAIVSYIEEHYPGARIVEIERENGITEVDIVDGHICRSLYFDSTNAWVRSEWDVPVHELPGAVTAAIAASEYSTWRIDDAEYVTTPTGDYYLVEVELGERERDLRIAPDGSFLN